MPLADIAAEIAATIQRDARDIEHAADAKIAGLEPGPFGMAIAMADGSLIRAGSADTVFPIQSISKVFALSLAIEKIGDPLFKRVGREPSGDPFNSVIDLERTCGVPRNPFINAGALVIVDMLVEHFGDRAKDAVLNLVRDGIDDTAAKSAVALDKDVLEEGGDLNRAMLHFMVHHDNIRSPIDAIMDAYARQCAVAVDCVGLAQAGRYLADTRISANTADRAKRMRTILALMMTCGHYDGSGDFAVRVGLPAKSGVGGGILAIAPGIASIAVWSPNLDQHGNSMLGVRALEMLNARTGWSVFGPPIS
ncbi:L-glutaminase [Sphingomonas sp. PP-CE-3G-477]|uniref:glutaminase A n=1 Tax=Sphingomonas sp. PP-CE-3G-477 TaxID=2135660 RepID=UPI000D3C2942|nr:glutaminase A [Sphingomonas sp. PP-CE-3G-477]PTQ65760.1 L-glutaminase [Sphingomonas sp. PP-CE-3G-477]